MSSKYMTILLIEDAHKLVNVLKKSLEMEGYVVDVAYNGEEGVRKGLQREHDLIILDLMLPKKDGIKVCRELRRRQVQAPIIMLTARDKVEDRVCGLDSGADDYLVKPFDFEELLARMRSLLRRKKTTKPVKLKIADLTLDPATHEVKRSKKLIYLSPKEYSLLDYLMRHPNQVLTRNKISEHVWGSRFNPLSNTIDVYIRHLRKKIDEKHGKKLIHTIRGTGYKIKE